jgi:VIT1/CCC1 family predicted Fe2+/Mn2+ transporter
MMKNWKTTLMGALLAVFTAWSTISIEEEITPKTIMMLIISGGIAALGYLMNDDILKSKK